MAISRRQLLTTSAAAGLGMTVGFASGAGAATVTAEQIRNHPDSAAFALVGDYGSGRPGQRSVAEMIRRWNPHSIFTLGDNAYSEVGADAADLIDAKVLAYYGGFVDDERFFPALGNADWGDPGTALLYRNEAGGTSGPWHDRFSYLPGNGRYYDVQVGPLHVFVLDDHHREPDGNRPGSVQYRWLESSASASSAPLKIVVHHHGSYVSSIHAVKGMRWPFGEWGIDAVFSGHWHHYERRSVDGVVYVVNGVGGAPIEFGGPRDPGVDALYAQGHGASRITASPDGVLIEFVSVDGMVRDQIVIPGRSSPAPAAGTPPPSEPSKPNPTDPTVVAGEPYRSLTGRAASLARLYIAVFERNPDRAGFHYWNGVNAPLVRVSEFFTSSDEFVSKYGRLDDEGFVKRVYHNVLGRGPDPFGFEYWVGLLVAGSTRGELVLGFSESTEFRSRIGLSG